MTADRGTRLVLAGVLLFVLTVAVSGVLAPDRAGTPGLPGDPTADGARETLVGSQGGGPGWHQYGSVYLLNGADVVWQEDSADSYFDVQRLDDGTVLAGFMHSGYEECGPYESPCARTGIRIIDPSADGGPEVVEEYSFPVRSQSNSEIHDAEPLPDGGYAMTDMDHERVIVVEDGEITWQWNASELYDAPEDPTRTDWLHINDIDRIGEDRFLVSVRNANQLVIVERTDDGGSEVVEIINEDTGGSDASCTKNGQLRDTDGDVRCGDPDVLNHQHNPQWLDDGAVLVADSDNDRVVELHRTDDGTWEPAWVLDRAEGMDLRWPRDADRLPNGHTVVTDTLNRRVFEIDENGTVVWSYATDRIPYEADRVPRELTGDASADLPRSDGDGTGVERAGGIPVLSTLVVGLRAVAPWAPVWFAETQIGLTLVALALVLAGAALRARSWLD
ncbi:aryl-sulfate sulfotransferase [Halorarum halophilum]|uniref:Aryl-sulfate sulfotransferase n=1 Tax=Halorarum halophilum TaxID=2743090 RepID=A0A7D5GXH1_9EURY|nr:aryl-sulfate sulfotransferase [Halobaculum halophilum]QLG27789.1 aryl-sulfate sulfotransferase [Halobaculum halophilum]